MNRSSVSTGSGLLFMGIFQSIICTGGICVFYACFNQKYTLLILKKRGKCGMILRLSAQAAATTGHTKKVSEPIDYRPALPCYKKRFSGA